MMGERTVAQEALLYGFSLERHVPADHLLRSIDRFVDLPFWRTSSQSNWMGQDCGRPVTKPMLAAVSPNQSNPPRD